MKYILFAFSCAVLLVLTACTEPITVGSDLLDNDRADLGQTVDLPFTTRVVRDDSLLVFDASENQASLFSFGLIEDNVFGRWKNSFYVVPSMPRDNSGLPIPPQFSFTTERSVDSLVLIVPLDTTYGFFGPGRSFTYQAKLIADRVDRTSDYYADVNLPLDEMAGTVNRENTFNLTLSPTLVYDTIYSAAPARDSVLVPHLRMAFNDAFLAEVNSRNQATFDGDSALSSLLAGVFVEPLADSDGIVALEPVRNNFSPISGFYFFYKDTTEAQTPRFYRVPLSLWPPRYEKDFNGSVTGELLADGEDRDRLALTGQEGTMIEITFTDLEALRNKVINQAEITFFREIVEGYSYDTYPAPEFVALYYKDANGDLRPIIDRERLVGNANGSVVRAFLGGDELRDENDNIFYRPRFSVHLQRIISGELPPVIYLRVVPVDRDPSRVILSGPDAAVRPASIKVTFTEIGG